MSRRARFGDPPRLSAMCVQSLAVEPVGTIEIAERLGVTRDAVNQWRRRDLGFPGPRWVVGGRPAWDWSEVERWSRTSGRKKLIVGPIYWAAFPGETLEKVMAVFLGQEHPLALRRTPDRGDGGVDILIESGDGWHVYQVKSFTGRLNAGRKKKIEHSLRAAVVDPRLSGKPIHRWTLAVPIDPTATEQAWFDDLRSAAPFPCNWAGESPFWHALAARHPHVTDYYLGGGRARVEARAAALMAAVEPGAGSLTAEDVSGRLGVLASTLNRESPHYRYEFHVGGQIEPDALPDDTAMAQSRTLDDGSWLTTIVRWKYLQAPQDAPIKGIANLTVWDRERGIDIKEAFENFRRFGTALEVPSGALSVSMESAPPGFQKQLPNGGGRIGPMLVSGGGIRRSRLRVVHPADGPLVELGLQTRSTSRGEQGVEVIASDDAGLLDMQFRFWPVDDGDHLQGTVHFDAHLSSIHGRPVMEVLPTVRFVAQFTPPNELQWLEEYGSAVLATNPFPEVVGNSLPDGNLTSFLENLSVVQNHVRGTVLVPDTIDDRLYNAVDEVATILRHGKLEGTWGEFSLQLKDDVSRDQTLAKLGDGGHIAIESEMSLEIEHQRYELGVMTQIVSGARLADDQPSGGRTIRFVPIEREGRWVQRLGPLQSAD